MKKAERLSEYENWKYLGRKDEYEIWKTPTMYLVCYRYGREFHFYETETEMRKFLNE